MIQGSKIIIINIGRRSYRAGSCLHRDAIDCSGQHMAGYGKRIIINVVGKGTCWLIRGSWDEDTPQSAGGHAACTARTRDAIKRNRIVFCVPYKDTIYSSGNIRVTRKRSCSSIIGDSIGIGCSTTDFQSIVVICRGSRPNNCNERWFRYHRYSPWQAFATMHCTVRSGDVW